MPNEPQKKPTQKKPNRGPKRDQSRQPQKHGERKDQPPKRDQDIGGDMGPSEPRKQ